MKKFVFASVALVALSVANMGSPAVAADMPAKVRPAPVPIFTWNGCYVGGFAGYAKGSSRHIGVEGSDAGVNITNDFPMSGGLGGLDIGCNYQAGNWVVGVELDGAWTNKDGQDFYIIEPFDFVAQTTERWIATARVRLGWAADKWLWYVTGGGAWAGVEVTEFSITGSAIFPVPVTGRSRKVVAGWTVGAGWEYSLGHGWSIKSEYLYIDFGTTRFQNPPDSCNDAPVGECDTTWDPSDVKLRNHVWKIGLNHRFDWGKGKGKAPVVVKY